MKKFGWYSLKISIFLIFVFLLQNFFPKNYFVLVSKEVLFKPWTVITYMFLHASFAHLFYNVFALALFGLILEKIIGSKNFLTLFFLAGIFSGIVSIFFYDAIIGASGAIFGLLGFLAAIRPKMVVPAFGIPLPIIVAIAFWLFFDIAGIFSSDQTAHIGHLSGLAFGILVGLKLRKKYRVKEKRRKPKVKIPEEKFREWEEKYLERKLTDKTLICNWCFFRAIF